MRGTVKKWFPERGYGFIEGADGNSYFVHYKSVRMEKKWKFLKEGENVTFTRKDRSGNMAYDVRPSDGR